MNRENGPLPRVAAETLGLEALAFLIGDEKLGPMFLEASGIAPRELAARASEPAVLVSVLNFLMQDDSWLRAFCHATGRSLTDPQRALWGLPGGAEIHWT